MILSNPVARRIIATEEGWRGRPYYCSEGYPSIGYGFKLGAKNAPLPSFSISLYTGEAWLDSNIHEIMHNTAHLTVNLNDVRQAVVLSMAYQMGVTGVLAFVKMLDAIDRRAYGEAAEEMLDSVWARQTPKRAQRHAWMMREGRVHSYYE